MKDCGWEGFFKHLSAADPKGCTRKFKLFEHQDIGGQMILRVPDMFHARSHSTSMYLKGWGDPSAGPMLYVTLSLDLFLHCCRSCTLAVRRITSSSSHDARPEFHVPHIGGVRAPLRYNDVYANSFLHFFFSTNGRPLRQSYLKSLATWYIQNDYRRGTITSAPSPAQAVSQSH